MSTVTPPSVVAKPPRLKKEKAGSVVAQTLGSRWGKILVYFIALFWTFPSLGLLVESVRPEKEVKSSVWWAAFMRPHFTLNNYKSVLNSADDDLGRYFLNSWRITIPAVFISIGVAALAAYAFSWMEFKGRDWLYSFVTLALIVPLQLCLIPLLRLFTGGAHVSYASRFPFLFTTGSDSHQITVFPFLHLNSSVAAVWIAHTIFGLPFCVFLLRNFMSGLPREIIEAARVDGASHLKVFRTIVLPLSVPSIASLGIFQFVYIWNDVLVGRVFGGSENIPIVSKMIDVTGARGQSWHLLTAAAFVSMVAPLAVFFALQRYFVKGLLAGSVKG
jgi:alpha-glucoside transport system permease protein